MKPLIYSASVMCANLARLEDDLRALEMAGCDELHFDIMDGVFVPNITLGPDLIRAAHECCGLPCAAHLMITRPERYIERFAEAGCKVITIHAEACAHAHRILGAIREAGCSPGLALDPATPLTALDYLADLADRVLLMTVDPGYAGQRILPAAFERVRILAEMLEKRERPAAIEVDGNIDVAHAARLANAGARIFVLGTSAVFRGRPDAQALRQAYGEFTTAVEKAREIL